VKSEEIQNSEPYCEILPIIPALGLFDFELLELIIINYNMYGLICNKYILYNGLSNYIRNEVIKFCISYYMS
jgi:hypothetical protein